MENDFEMCDFEYPVNLKDINECEKLNLNILSMFSVMTGYISLRISKYMDRRSINLLSISDEHDNQHYCLIKEMRWLLSSQTNVLDCAVLDV